jgi:hypothetical protein
MSIINVLKRPSVWSPSYNPILWMVDSDQTTQFKFRYVFDVYINGNTPIRFKVPPNPNGIGIIDVQTLVAGELNIAENTPFISTLPFYLGEGLASTVYILAGEEYATTATGTTTLYNGSGSPGEPAYGLYADPDWRPCPNATTPVVAWASGQGADEWYNYNATSGESILTYEMNLPNPDVDGKFLTRCPYTPQTIRSDEDFTLSWLNWNFETEQLYGEVPYTMRLTLYDDNNYIGFADYYNTPAEGGTGWNTCSSWGGVTGDNYWLQSFKINPLDVDSYTQDQQAIFGTEYGCETLPLGDGGIFPGIHDSGLSPASNPSIVLSIYDDSYIEPSFNSNCTTGFGIGYTGWSDLAYRSMGIYVGDVIEIQIPSLNPVAGNFPTMYLWGATGAFTDPSKWEQIAAFTPSNVGLYKQYNLTHTATKNYSALGLRWFSGSSVSCGKFGCFSDYWNVIAPIAPGGFNKFCLALHKYSDYPACQVDPVPISETICLEINDDNCWGFDPIRFTWLNNLGGRDWFTFIKRNTNTQNASRSTMYRVPGYWSAADFSIQQLNPSRYGTTVYNVELTNTWTASTDWISEEQSEWLRSMFASPSVFVYLPGRTQPTAITITDASYSVQTYAREKLFQYFVSFVEAHVDTVQSY